MHKKGQAAMEFLMTYGWAILAAIIAIGVLAYFGVFSPGRLVAGAATANAPFGINAHNILSTGTTDGTVQLEMIQNSGDTLENVVVAITGTGAMSTVTCTAALAGQWSSGTVKRVADGLAIDCTDGGVGDPMIAGETFTGNIAISYNKLGSTLTQTTSGSIRGAIQ